MIPKHANPYLLTEQTTVVSRAALREDDDDEREPLDVSMHPERAEMLARLENILKRSIEDVLPSSTHTAVNEEAEAEADGGSRKKKRRKVGVTKEEQPVAVRTSHSSFFSYSLRWPEQITCEAFRLLSGTAQPKPILLAPKAPRVLMCVDRLPTDRGARY